MRTLLVSFLVSAAVTVLIVGAIVQLLVQLAPYMVLIAAAGLVVRVLRGRSGIPPAAHRPPAQLPARRTQATGYHRAPRAAAPPPPVGWAAGRPQGWVLMPVWVGPRAPRPHPTVIDAEVIEDDDRG